MLVPATRPVSSASLPICPHSSASRPKRKLFPKLEFRDEFFWAAVKNISKFVSVGSVRGRPRRSGVDRFRATAWFYCVAYETGDYVPHSLQSRFQPEQIYKDGDKQTSSGAWHKYRAGTRLPGVGFDRAGKPRIATTVGEAHPFTLEVFDHPLWDAMRNEPISLRKFDRALKGRPILEAGYYADLSRRNEVSLVHHPDIPLSSGVWIEIGEHAGAFDHLGLHLMLLRIGGIHWDEQMLKFIAKRVGRLLGFVANAPWISPFYEEMFDWMDANVCGKLFNYLEDSDGRVGWRRSRSLWIEAPNLKKR